MSCCDCVCLDKSPIHTCTHAFIHTLVPVVTGVTKSTNTEKITHAHTLPIHPPGSSSRKGDSRGVAAAHESGLYVGSTGHFKLKSARDGDLRSDVCRCGVCVCITAETPLRAKIAGRAA